MRRLPQIGRQMGAVVGADRHDDGIRRAPQGDQPFPARFGAQRARDGLSQDAAHGGLVRADGQAGLQRQSDPRPGVWLRLQLGQQTPDFGREIEVAVACACMCAILSHIVLRRAQGRRHRNGGADREQSGENGREEFNVWHDGRIPW